MEETKSVFQVLKAVNCNENTETKNGLTYLSWPFAWGNVKSLYPDATYNIHKNDSGLPYFVDAMIGIMVFTDVTIQGQTYEMWLPVMDSANKAMKLEPYTYQVYDKYNGKYVEKTVEAATMFDINKTVMRCLTKNLAMFGLGLYIYAGEDLPTEFGEAPAEQPKTAVETRKAVKTVKKKSAPNAAYVPMDDDTFWKVIKCFATGKVSKSGEDYRSVWVSQTNAGKDEVAMFNQKVREYCEVYGYELPSNL